VLKKSKAKFRERGFTVISQPCDTQELGPITSRGFVLWPVVMYQQPAIFSLKSVTTDEAPRARLLRYVAHDDGPTISRSEWLHNSAT
jgi:hypothetical protein